MSEVKFIINTQYLLIFCLTEVCFATVHMKRTARHWMVTMKPTV